MPSQEQQLRDLERIEQYRALRNLAFGLGLVAFVLALMAYGLGGRGNPASASSAYLAFEIAGLMQWAAIPLASASLALIIVGAILHGLSKRKHGEV